MKIKMLASSVALLLLVLIAGCTSPRGVVPIVAPMPKPILVPVPSPIKTPCVRVLAFTASWCQPCQRAKPTLVQIKAAGVEVQIIDIDEQPELARQYGITSVPTFFVYVCGREAVRTQDVSVVAALTRFRCK